MFKTKKILEDIKKWQDLINAKIEELSYNFDQFFNRLQGHWDSDNKYQIDVFTGYLMSDLGFLNLDADKNNANVLFSIGHDLVGVCAFIDVKGAPDELVDLFEITYLKYADAYADETGEMPVCYKNWEYVVKKHRGTADGN